VLRFSDGGGDPYWTVNAVEVRPVYDEFIVSGPGGALPADGTTLDQFTVAEGQYKPNAWYTLSTDQGRIAAVDGDSRYAGVQVQAPASGDFVFQVLRGTTAGTANVRVEEVNGASRGGVLQEYVHAALRRFDFNGSGADTQLDAPNGFWSVRGNDVYTAAAGYGWNAAVSEFQRGTAGISEPQLDSLYRDGHWQSAPRTFQVTVKPNKSYDVRIHTGDSSFARDHLQVTVEGNTRPLMATAANEFKSFTVTVPANTVGDDGILDIQIANLGGDPYWVINGIEVAESTTNVPPGPGLPDLPVPPPPSPSAATRFDFNSGGSLTANGFTGVGTSNLYDPLQGYGWQTTASTFSRSGPNDLLRDGHWGTDNTFLVNVAPGSYVVNVTLGDAGFARNFIQVDVNGAAQISNLATAAGQFAHATTGTVSPVNGQLAIRVRSTGGDPYFTINALEILAAPQANHNLTTSNGLTFTGTSTAPNGALVTVATSLGSIASPDADTSYAGVQVVVTGGTFSFTVTPPAGGGTATVSSEEVTGLGKGSAIRNYAAPTVRRFDFNGSGNAPQGGFTGVRGNSLYNANNGYGWTTTVSEFERGTAGYTVNPTNVPLYRDGHWGSAARTFQVAVDPAETYDVRVYVGDRSFARDYIQVTVEGAAAQIVPPTTANQFQALTITGSDTNSNGILTITITNTGGDPYWVINGIDVWQSDASDPGALNLLAGQWGSERVGQSLTQAAIDAVLPWAREYWVSTGLADWQLIQLYQTPIAIGDLSNRGALGVTRPEGIWLDAGGAGLGWSVGSSQWSVGSGSQTTANGQLPTAAYDLLTVVTHELGHVLGYDDLDPLHHSDHIMAGVLQPGTARIEIAVGGGTSPWVAGAERDSGIVPLLGPAAGGRGPLWVAGAERDSGIAPLLGPAAGGREPLGEHGPLVDRVLDDLLRDDLRASENAGHGNEDDEFDVLRSGHDHNTHSELDAFFAQLG
ncbi:MAG: hypothetical protein KJ000_35890, partial [Pirellulaceae bacterium]|nr:hypothetical protein [Pirellulaceae bacterium]